MKTKYKLEGLDCANCALKIEKELIKSEYLSAASINFATKTLTATTNGDRRAEIERIVRDLEPDVSVVPIGGEETENKKNRFLFFAGVISFIAAFFIPASIGWVAYSAAFLLIGYNVIYKAFRNLLKGRVMDENFLMTIAGMGAFAIGEYPEGAAVMLFYYVGEYFQERAVNHSRRQIEGLLNIKPEYAIRLKDGKEERISPSEALPGDVIIIKPGERVPLDGEIIEGKSALDMKALTGESIPVDVEPGHTILSGSLNINGAITVRVQKGYNDSTVSKILDLIENAASKKSRTESFITKFARVYTPAVVLTALLIGVIPPLFIGFEHFYSWLYKGLVFLVVSCPCALVISIPLGYFGGIGACSKKGILVKGSNYLNALTNVETVLFDKTGTLTKGEFSIKALSAAKGITEEELLTLSAYAQARSNHPIAKSILAAYKGQIDFGRIEDYQEIAGNGVKTKLDGKILIAGNRRFMKEEGIIIDESEANVFVAYDGAYVGSVTVADTEREDSKAAVEELSSQGISVIMLTGDKKETANAVAQRLGNIKAISELLPQDKAAVIERLKISAKGNIVFAGDGINDAPSLKLADIGISMGGVGSDAAIEASDVVLMNDKPSLIGEGIRIAKRTKRIVTQNIILSLSIKFAILLLSIIGVATMWEAVFADVGVSILAILNSARLLRR